MDPLKQPGTPKPGGADPQFQNYREKIPPAPAGSASMMPPPRKSFMTPAQPAAPKTPLPTPSSTPSPEPRPAPPKPVPTETVPPKPPINLIQKQPTQPEEPVSRIPWPKPAQAVAPASAPTPTPIRPVPPVPAPAPVMPLTPHPTPPAAPRPPFATPRPPVVAPRPSAPAAPVSPATPAAPVVPAQAPTAPGLKPIPKVPVTPVVPIVPIIPIPPAEPSTPTQTAAQPQVRPEARPQPSIPHTTQLPPQPISSDLPPLPPLTRPVLAAKQAIPPMMPLPVEDQSGPLVSTFVGATGSVSQPPPSDVMQSAGQPMPPRQFMSTSVPPRRHPLRRIGLFIVVMALMSVVVYVAYATILTPKLALPGAISVLDTATTMHTTFSANIVSDNVQIHGSSLDVQTDFDRTLTESPLNRSVISLTSGNSELKGELRLVRGTLYGELLHVPESYSSKFAAYAGKWYSISLDAFRSYAQRSNGITIPSGIILGETYTKLSQAGVFTNAALVGFGFANGRPVRYYRLNVDKIALGKFLATQYGAENATGLLELVSFSPISVAIDLVNGSMKSVGVDVTVHMPQNPLSGPFVARLKIGGTFDDTPADYAIAAPPEAVSLDGFLSDSSQSTQVLGRNARLVADVQQARTELETAYDGRSYPLTCTTKNLSIIRADMQDIGSSLTCRVDVDKYYVAAKLLATSTPPSTLYFCTDWQGSQKYLTRLPAGYACK